MDRRNMSEASRPRRLPAFTAVALAAACSMTVLPLFASGFGVGTTIGVGVGVRTNPRHRARSRSMMPLVPTSVDPPNSPTAMRSVPVRATSTSSQSTFGGRSPLFVPAGRRCRSRETFMSSAVRLAMSTSAEGGNGGSSGGGPLELLRRFFAALWNLFVSKPIQAIGSILNGGNGNTNGDDSKDNDAEAVPTMPVAAAETTPAPAAAATTPAPAAAAVKVEVASTVDSPSSVASSPAQPATTVAVTADVAEPPHPVYSVGLSKVNERTATSAPTVSLSGEWTLIADDKFRNQYDDYLRLLGQPSLVRTVARTAVGSTKEEMRQSEDGQELYIKGMSVMGSWERTLEASERDFSMAEQGGKLEGLFSHEEEAAAEAAVEAKGEGSKKKGSKKEGSEKKGSEKKRKTPQTVQGHALKPMTTADDEVVRAASWWERGGTVHRSWVVGGRKYGGGDFENLRYLADGGNVLVCESTFHPNDDTREKAKVTWKFLREGAIYGDSGSAFEVEFPNLLGKKEAEAEAETVLPSSRMVVGDILDESIASAAEVGFDIGVTTPQDISASDMIEEYVEQEMWVPPFGKRWAISAPGVDLTGKWKLIISEQFKTDYDDFLASLDQPFLVRAAAMICVANTREKTKQAESGRSLKIKGINAKGVWERTLVTSGSDADSTLEPGPDGKYKHDRIQIVTADATPEKVMAESWWEEGGTMHVSWTLGVTKYGGGAFESRRYLENDGNVYVCESTFHPNDKAKKPSYLKWKFLREGATLFVGSCAAFPGDELCVP